MEINVAGSGESFGADDAAFFLGRLNQLIDNWNAQREAIVAEEFLTFTFVANQQDYEIGPTAADFTVTSRPVSIEGANVLLDNVSPVVSNPIVMRDYQWWLDLTVRAVSTTFPTDCYYEPSYPNGVLHFWPKPTTPYGLEIAVRQVLAQTTINGQLVLPPGYQNALMLTLAEDCAPAYGALALGSLPLTREKARQARNRIFINNDLTPRLTTQDAGMPSNNRNRCTFNYRSGLDMLTNH